MDAARRKSDLDNHLGRRIHQFSRIPSVRSKRNILAAVPEMGRCIVGECNMLITTHEPKGVPIGHR